jgi:hypothetical protein
MQTSQATTLFGLVVARLLLQAQAHTLTTQEHTS